MARLDILTPIQQGLQIRQGLAQGRTQGLQQQLLQQQLQGIQQSQPLQQQQSQIDLQKSKGLAQSLSELAPFAQRLTVMNDASKLGALQNEKLSRQQAGLDTSIIDEGIALAEAGEFGELSETLGQIIQAGQPAADFKSFAPVQTTTAEGGIGLAIPQVGPDGQTRLQPLDLGGLDLTKEAPAAKREAELQAAIAKKQGELIANQRQTIKTEIISAGRNARRQIKDIDRIEEAFQAIDTGKITQATRLLGPFIPGVDPTDEQALQASINSLVMQQIGNLPGALSEKELVFAKEATANLGFTREANLIIIRRLKRAQQDLIDEEQQFKKFTKGGGNPEDFEFDISGPPPGVGEIAQREQAIEDAPAQAKAISDQIGQQDLTPQQSSLIEQLKAAGATEEEINEALRGS